MMIDVSAASRLSFYEQTSTTYKLVASLFQDKFLHLFPRIRWTA